MSSARFRLSLNFLIFIGLLAGVVVGQWIFDPAWDGRDVVAHINHHWLSFFHFIGFTVFMGLLKMLVVPLIVVSVIVAVSSLGDVRELGRLGGWTLFYYATTMFVAVGIGILCVVTIAPGKGFELTSREVMSVSDDLVVSAQGGVIGAFGNLIAQMIPSNVFQALAAGETLALILFSMFFGVVVTLLGSEAQILRQTLQALYSVVLRMVEIVLYLAPVGVFALSAWSIGRIGLGVFGESIGLYMGTVLLGLFVDGVVILPLILWIFGKTNPYRYLWSMRPALLTAFGTDSSAATLPVSIETAITEGGVRARVAGLVFPLGATLNMDG
ncbi:MAG: dicarboxylate/amino acid:cation symporter, partial [Bdellovibrionales bacterium]|nr:dicarboxylate/amino acid:cation symporter [Bdellovibrionales bacterium]